MEKWLKDNINPPSIYNVGTVKTFKGAVSEYATAQFPSRERIYSLANNIQTIARGGQIYAALYDQEDDLSDLGDVIQVGMPLYIEDSKDWLKGHVVRVVGNILEVAFTEKPERAHRWVDLESDTVVPSKAQGN
jgi:hypothetical protein